MLSALLLRPEAALHVRELAGLLRKTAGLVDLLCQALVPYQGACTQRCGVMVVGDLDFADVVLALSGAQEFLRREINPIVLSRAEWDRKLAQADGFAAQVWQGSKLWLVGKHES